VATVLLAAIWEAVSWELGAVRGILLQGSSGCAFTSIWRPDLIAREAHKYADGGAPHSLLEDRATLADT
jgi:hypothetical protein